MDVHSVVCDSYRQPQREQEPQTSSCLYLHTFSKTPDVYIYVFRDVV